MNITDSNFSTVGGYNFSQFAEPPGADGDFAAYAEQGVRYAAIADGVLYVSIGHRTYASASPHTAYILAIDLDTNEVLWKSGDQVCNSNHFLIMKDSILCGYGFSAEPDYIYILNRRNGKTQEKIKVASAPYYFIPDEEELYVLTYNTAYRYRVSFDE
ncbi:MAG: hypothetical protein IJ711_06910 [Lachnospiraceae bacterium]|nr:hypothetical protein [Lachnospiraceae bacterium]